MFFFCFFCFFQATILQLPRIFVKDDAQAADAAGGAAAAAGARPAKPVAARLELEHQGTTRSIVMGGRAMERDFL